VVGSVVLGALAAIPLVGLRRRSRAI
jgi:hypothetical protein